MAITGLSTELSIVGPFRSSTGNYYIFGKDGSNDTILQAFKSSDPDGSWSSIDTVTGFSTDISSCRGRQVGDLIHLIVADGSGTSVNYKYLTFDMSSDAFDISETIASGLDTRSNTLYTMYACSVEVRSGGEVVAVFDGTRKNYSGQRYAHAYYSRRTGTNTWTAPTEIADAAGDQGMITTVIDADDNITIQYFAGGKFLTAANAIQAGIDILDPPAEGVVYTNASNEQQIGFITGSYWVSLKPGDTEASSSVNLDIGATLGRPFVDTGAAQPTVWAIYKNAANKIVAKSSTDNGATWSTSAVVTEDSTNYSDLSHNSRIYSSGDDVLASIIYVDAAASTGHKGHVVRSKKVNINLSASVGTGAVASVSKYIGKIADSASSAAAIDNGTSSIAIGLSKTSGIAGKASLIAEGGSVDVALESVSFGMVGGSFATGLETEGGSIQLNLTRLGPGGYPIAALPGAPGGPSTSVGLFSADAVPTVGAFSNYTFTVGFPSAASSAAISVPIWQNAKGLRAITVSAGSGSFAIESQPAELSSIATAAAFNSLGSLAKSNLIAVWTHGIADELGFEASVVLEASIATAATAEFSPFAFTGTSIELNSAASQAVAVDTIPQNQIVLSESIASASANIILMEGDEAFNLAAAAASGTVGDLLVAIVIPPAIKWLVCASIDIVPEVAGDLAMNAELQATVIAAAALQGSPQIGPEVDGTFEIAPLVGGSPAMKEC